jgi:hypothetical protein
MSFIRARRLSSVTLPASRPKPLKSIGPRPVCGRASVGFANWSRTPPLSGRLTGHLIAARRGPLTTEGGRVRTDSEAHRPDFRRLHAGVKAVLRRLGHPGRVAGPLAAQRGGWPEQT